VSKVIETEVGGSKSKETKLKLCTTRKARIMTAGGKGQALGASTAIPCGGEKKCGFRTEGERDDSQRKAKCEDTTTAKRHAKDAS
jgi:hypothetical protein